MPIGIVTASQVTGKAMPSKNLSGKTPQKKSHQLSFGVSPSNNNNKTSLITGAAIIAALGIGLGIYAHKTGMLKAGVKKLNPSASTIKEKIAQVKANSMDEIDRIIRENTGIDGIHLDVIDNAAGIRSADLSQPERFHQAATWIEEAYKRAYEKAELSDNKNMLNYIYNRVNTENNTLAKMYAQMPEQEANMRMTQFAKDVAAQDIHTGMTVQQFVKDMQEIFIPKAKTQL